MKLQLLDRLAELPYRFKPIARETALTWPITNADRARIRITWPTEYFWPPTRGIVETLEESLVNAGVTDVAPSPQTLSGAIMLHCRVDGQPKIVAMDVADYPDFINEEALAQCDLYFKAQHRRQGYENPKIVKAGYPVTGCDFYRYYKPYRERFQNNRRIDVLGRFGYKFQGDLRRHAVSLLSEATDINYVGNTGKVRYSAFVREAASAKMCLHLPGNGPFTHRVAEFIGLGSCMVSIPFDTVLHVPLEPGVHYVEVAPDLSDLVDVCRYYRDHDEERERIARAGREYFDRNLHCDQLAAYHIRTILDRLGSK